MLPQSECANQNPLQPLGVKKLKKQNKKCCRRVNVLTRIRCNPWGSTRSFSKRLLRTSRLPHVSLNLHKFPPTSLNLFELLLRAEICSHRRDDQSCKIFASYKKFSKKRTHVLALSKVTLGVTSYKVNEQISYF